MTTTVESQGTVLKIETAVSGVYAVIGEVQSFSGPGGSAKVIDITSLASTRKEKRMGLPDEGQFSLSLNFNPSDAGQALLFAARNARTRKNFRVEYTNGTVDTFAGYVLEFSTSGDRDDVLKAKATVEIDGAVTRT